MELPFPSAFGPCMVVVPEAYAGLVQERWAVFVHEVEQLLRYLHGLSVANDGGSGGGVCGYWPLHGLGGGYPPTHPPPPPPPRPDPTRPKGHHPGFAPKAAHRLADDGGGSFSLPPSPPPPPAPRIPRGPGAPEPGSDAGSLRSDSGRSSASSTVIDSPFPVLPTPSRPGGRAPTAVAPADDDDACPSCRRTGARVDAPADEDARRRRRREPGLRRASRRNRPRDVRAEYEAGGTPGEAGKRGTTW